MPAPGASGGVVAARPQLAPFPDCLVGVGDRARRSMPRESRDGTNDKKRPAESSTPRVRGDDASVSHRPDPSESPTSEGVLMARAARAQRSVPSDVVAEDIETFMLEGD